MVVRLVTTEQLTLRLRPRFHVPYRRESPRRAAEAASMRDRKTSGGAIVGGLATGAGRVGVGVAEGVGAGGGVGVRSGSGAGGAGTLKVTSATAMIGPVAKRVRHARLGPGRGGKSAQLTVCLFVPATLQATTLGPVHDPVWPTAVHETPGSTARTTGK